MTDYAASRAARARRCNKPADDDAELVLRSPVPIVLETAVIARRFVVWLREMGLAGRYTSLQIADLIDWYYHEHNVVRASDHQGLIAQIRCQPGVLVTRPRQAAMVATWKPSAAAVNADTSLSASPMRPIIYTIQHASMLDGSVKLAA